LIRYDPYVNVNVIQVNPLRHPQPQRNDYPTLL